MIAYNDFFIGKIYIIAKKTELGNFCFENQARQWHGFVLLIDGKGSFIDENNHKQSFSAGDILLLGRGYRYQINIPHHCSYITSAFDIYFDQLIDIHVFPQILHLDDASIASFDQIARIYAEQEENATARCRILLTQLYLKLLHRFTPSIEVNEQAGQAELIIRRTFRQNLSISEIANQCNISPSYLRASFARTYGMSMTHYRERLRIEEAEILIRCGFFSLKEIAEQLGYCDVFHFTKNFTRAKGISPAKYREQCLID